MWAPLLTDSTCACACACGCRGSFQPARVSAPPQPRPPLCLRLFLLTNKAGRTGSISRTNTRRPVFCPCEEMLLPRHQAPRASKVRQQAEWLVANSWGRSQHPHYRGPLGFPARAVRSVEAGHYKHSAFLHIHQIKIIICSLLSCTIQINPNL